MLRPVFKSCDNSTQPDRTAANHDNSSVASFLGVQKAKSVLGPKEARGKDVRHENQGFLVDFGRGFHDGAIGEGNSHVLGLGTIQTGAAKQQAVRTA